MKKKTHKEFVREMYVLYKCDFSVLSLYKDAKTKLTVKCNKCGNIYDTKPTNILSGYRCKKCHHIKLHNLKKMSDKEFIKRLNKKHPDVELLSKYINSRKNIIIKNNKCGHVFNAIPYSYLNREISCPVCGRIGMGKCTNDDFLEKLKKVNKYITPLSKYSKSSEHILVRNDKCGHEWIITPANLLKGHDCPKCRFSKGEKIINNILTIKEIFFESQKEFDDCVYKKRLRFDFFIKELNLAIEYNGRQHYEPVDIFGGMDGFKKTIIRDNIKKDWCDDNNVNLLIIKYDEDIVSKLNIYL